MGQNEKGKTAQRFLIVEVNIVCASIYDVGNTLTAPGGWSYTYDAENRLILAVNSGLGTTASYTYDGDGNRVSKTVNGVRTDYVVDTQNPTGYAQVLAEIQGGEVTKRYTYGHDLISMERKVGTDWVPSYYTYDGTGSVRALTDATGAVTDSYDYDAFGTVLNSSGSTPNEYLFHGERKDPETGLVYLRARYMDPSIGRFTTMDSYEGKNDDPSSLHKYTSFNDDPVNRSDPSGHEGIMGPMGARISEILQGLFVLKGGGTVTVYIWPFLGADVAWGHASLAYVGPFGTGYISWWPSQPHEPKLPVSGLRALEKLHGGAGFLRNIYTAPAIRNRTYEADLEAEAAEGNYPEEIVITCLNVRGIHDWWKRRQNYSQLYWSTFGPNCATTVHDALFAGGGQSPMLMGPVFTPNQAKKYAMALRDKCASK